MHSYQLPLVSQPLFGVKDLPPPAAGPAGYTIGCDPNLVFRTEKDLELAIFHDPEALAFISRQLGYALVDVERQVRVSSRLLQRADLMARGARRHRELAVVEIARTMDGEHVMRSLGYAIFSQASDVVLLASHFPPNVLALIEAVTPTFTKLGIRVHLVVVHTSKALQEDKFYYHLQSLHTPSRQDAREAFLQDLAQQVDELGDSSLLGCPVYEKKRVEAYGGLGQYCRIRIGAGYDSARISVMIADEALCDALRRHWPHQELEQSLQAVQLQESVAGDTSQLAAYGFFLDCTSRESREESLLAIGLAYIEIRQKLLQVLADTQNLKPAQRAIYRNRHS